MEKTISFESYEMIEKMANKYAYGNTSSIQFDQFKDAGLEALVGAYKTYDEKSGIKFSTYLYRCVQNAMINEKIRQAVHHMQVDENISATLDDDEGYSAPLAEIIEFDRLEMLHNIIRKVTKSERNATIVEMHLGIEEEPMDLKDIAKALNLCHESVRLVCVKAQKEMKKNPRIVETLYSLVG